MTRLQPSSSARLRSGRIRLPKPLTVDDVADLHELAARLAGEPVPGVRMTEKQFEAWCDSDVAAEWVDGIVILIPPESFAEVDLAGWLTRILGEIVDQGDRGVLIGRHFIVRLPGQRRRRSPDLFFVRKRRVRLFSETRLNGAPDLIVELTSHDSQSRDRREKFYEYQRAGVREYWILDPVGQHVEAYVLGKDKRFHRIEEIDGKLASAVLPGFYLRPDWLRRPKLPPVAKVLRELGVRR